MYAQVKPICYTPARVPEPRFSFSFRGLYTAVDYFRKTAGTFLPGTPPTRLAATHPTKSRAPVVRVKFLKL